MLPMMRGKASAKRSTKPRIAIVGAGNLASALAASLHAAGYAIEQIVSHDRTCSLRRAKQLASRLGAAVVPASQARIFAEIVWFCVPDSAIAEAAKSTEKSTDWNNKIALHSSGALTSDELSRLKKRGARVASVHPLMTFVRGSQPSLAGVPFAIEGDARAVEQARRIVKSLGGNAHLIPTRNKAAYHAWGMFASPFFTALLATCEQVAAGAGVKRDAAKKRMLPILKQTLANYEAFGAAGTFSGPIARGDVETVERHAAILQNAPVTWAVYVALARAALDYLPAKNKDSLRRILNSHYPGAI
jgi:predicted short-subunit dehydrogenase-like oxidoreductase (DUF2520 family)